MPLPKQAIKNAKKALVDRDKFNPKPMTSSGLLSARLISQDKFPKSRYPKAFSFLSRHLAQYNSNPTPRRLVAINGWGGKSMLSYLKSKGFGS
jgi:hypothetical protein